jgi:two-component system, cell cycle sensor histidine kinase DivJ
LRTSLSAAILKLAGISLRRVSALSVRLTAIATIRAQAREECPQSGRKTNIVSLSDLVGSYLAALVHPAVAHNALLSARHRIFIASRLFSGVILLAAFPIYIIMRDAPNTLEAFVFIWSIVPILIAYYLSRTGQYESAQVFSAVALLGFGAVIAGTGGVGILAAVWFVIALLEAALSTSSRVLVFTSALTVTAAGLLWFAAQDQSLVAPSSGESVLTLGIAAAILHTATLVVGTQHLSRTYSALLKEQSNRYRLLAGNMTEVITQHDRNGAILWASQQAETMFNAPTQSLIGNGLLNRVHVADRPAYLTALGDAAAFGQARSLEIRARRDSIGRAGQFIWMEMSCRPVIASGDAGDKSPEIVAVIRDITERKARDRTIEAMAAQIDQATTVHGKLLAIIAREETQPLNSFTPPRKNMVKKSA